MELQRYFQLFVKWLWLLVLGLLLGAAAGFIYSRIEKPEYTVSSAIMVLQERNSDLASLNGQYLVETYVALIQTQPVLDAASAKAGFNIKFKDIIVAPVSSTQIIQIFVTDEDPQKAVAAADALADSVVELNELQQVEKYNEAVAEVSSQIDKVEKQLLAIRQEYDQMIAGDVQAQIEEVDAQIASLQPEVVELQKEIAKANAVLYLTPEQREALGEKQARLSQIEPLLRNYQEIRVNLVYLGQPTQSGNSRENSKTIQLDATIRSYQDLYLSLLTNREALRLIRFVPGITKVASAALPEKPVRPIPLLYTMLGAAAGAALAFALAAFLEYQNNTIRTYEDFQKIIQHPILAHIPELPHGRKSATNLAIEKVATPGADSLRTLRSELALAEMTKPIKTIVVLSPSDQNGKTTLAINLAIGFGLIGKHNLLIDSNARNPKLDSLVTTDGGPGLSELLSEKALLKDAQQSLEKYPNLKIIVNGGTTHEYSDLIASSQLEKLLEELSNQFDMVIIDGPSLMVPDALPLASHADGVLLVVRPGYTKRDEAAVGMEKLKRVGANVLGVVVNGAFRP